MLARIAHGGTCARNHFHDRDQVSPRSVSQSISLDLSRESNMYSSRSLWEQEHAAPAQDSLHSSYVRHPALVSLTKQLAFVRLDTQV